MAIILSASVGIKARNHTWDVTMIQHTLNKVPPEEGGPVPALKLDGLCGPKTKSAIQKFQLKHFGWKGADGKIEPGKQTHRKLNEFDEPKPTQPKPPPPPARLPEPAAKKFVIQRVGREDSFGRLDRDWFFRIISVPHNFEAIYWLGRGRRGMPAPVPEKFRGKPTIFETKKPMKTGEFGSQAAFLTTERKSGLDSKLFLVTEEPLVIPMQTHLIGPRGLLSARPPGGAFGTSTHQSGNFLIASRNQAIAAS